MIQQHLEPGVKGVVELKAPTKIKQRIPKKYARAVKSAEYGERGHMVRELACHDGLYDIGF